MFKMKKILGILLAFCFLMSVTAASASADSVTVVKEEQKVIEQKTVVVKEEKEHHDGFHEHHGGFHEHHHKKHFHPGHWDKKRVGHREFINYQWTYVYVYESYFVEGYWDYN